MGSLTQPTEKVGVVVIGRNEGDRLMRCLESLREQTGRVVYVDSCSSDNSVEAVRALGVEVAELTDPSTLSAARGRNLGMDRLLELYPEIELFQFVDGDCMVSAGWLAQAEDVFARNPAVVAVCGWRLEARPRRNVYHRIARLEWRMGAIGEVDDFAGEVMVRRSSIDAVGQYNPMIVAGEDTEFASRIRTTGTIVRLDAPCSTHDIAMDRFGQWWKRAERGGYGFTLVAELHRNDSKLFVKQTARVWLWGGVLPLIGVLLLRRTRLPLALVGARYAVSALRAARGVKVSDANLADRAAWGVSCVVSTVPAFLGSVRYLRERMSGKRPRLQEYH